MTLLNALFQLTLLGSLQAEYFENFKASDIFPQNYDKYEPPWKNGSPAHVYLQLNVMDVDRIDDGTMEFSLQSYLIELWIDRRLNLSEFQNQQNLNRVFPTYLTKHLWVPDLVFDNTKNGMLFHLSLPNTVIKVMKDGSFFRSTRYNLLVGCRMDFRFYPMDTQKCFVKIATMANPDYKVLLHWAEERQPDGLKSIRFAYDIEPLKYTLEEPMSHKSTEIWTSGNYTYLYANFTFVRRLSRSVFNTYVPSTLVVLLSWISFWLEVEAVPARVTLGVTSLLTLATQVVQAHSNLPPISYMTAMDLWLFVCLITVFSSLLEFAFAYQLNVWNKQKRSSVTESRQQEKTAVKKDDMRVLRPRLNDKNHPSSRISKYLNPDSVVPEDASNTETNQKSLDKICRILFPFLFSVFSITYWAYYMCIK